MDRVNEEYWYNQWHNDYELHSKLGIKNVTQISSKKNDNGDRIEPASIYADTDSCDASTIIQTSNGPLRIEDWYNLNIINGSNGSTYRGHDSVKTNDSVLNFNNNEISYSPVKRIIRHRVSKPKWKLKTKSGKEIIVTNDHSMIVFRNDKKIEIKPSEILKSDKILIIN